MTARRQLAAALVTLAAAAAGFGQTAVAPAKRLPPAGIALAAADRAELTAGAAALRQDIDQLGRELARTPTLAALLPDLEIFHKAVDWALRYDEFFAPKEIALARHFLAEGRERVAQVRSGRASWLDAKGLVVRGYRSKLDGSVQPYGLFVPAGWQRERPNRLEVWLLGRGEKRTELAFLAEREAGPPQLVPRDTIVLVPYGRFCNATKFAGEVDVFEAMAAVRAENVIDPQRTSVAGFSMGGASVWHLATHHAGVWSSASPGAGFAETPVYTKAFAPGHEPPTAWEQQLWNWYDATPYAANLFNTAMVAYSGEIDPQKQSADVMEAAMAAEGLKLERFIGPKTGHQYQPDTKKQLLARLEQIADRGREAFPSEVRVTTYTLRYPGDNWITPHGLEHHWTRADLSATLDGSGVAHITTKNLTALTLPALVRSAAIDGDTVPLGGGDPNRQVWLRRTGGHWQPGAPWTSPHKDHGLTGPIDDAFMDPFLFVRPTGQPLNAKVGDWASGELARATKMWRDIFRGELPLKDDNTVDADDIARHNLVLWGDPASNRVLARIIDRLPLTWDREHLVFRGHTYDATHTAPVLIFPNPLNPAHYVVLNSGIDFRDHAYGTNALQIAKLPDYAVIDLDTPPGPRWPGRVVDAGFFDEEWK